MLIFEWLKIVLVFVVMISVLVAAHEYGHYLFARIFKMGVHEFAIGFGKKPLWVWMRRTHRIPLSESESSAVISAELAPETGEVGSDETNKFRKAVFEFEGASTAHERIIRDGDGKPIALEEETQYTVRPWPLGGFVKIKAMMPEDDGSEIHVPAGFYSRAPWKRFVVLLAGPVFSILAGIVILFGLNLYAGIEGPQTNEIAEVTKDGALAKSGLLPGDRIVSIDGAPVKKAYDIVTKVRDNAGQTFELTVQRGESNFKVTVVPQLEEDQSLVLGPPDGQPTGELRKQAKIGIGFAHRVRVGVGEALRLALYTPVAVMQNLAKLVQGQVRVKDSVGGPIAMVGMTKMATDAGVTSIVELAGMLSISVGIFNLLPIHPLDGGQMVVAFAEILRGGRRLSMRVQNTLAGVGVSLLLIMVVGILFIDVGRYVHPDKAGTTTASK